MPSKRSQTEKTNTVRSLICEILKKKKKKIATENILVVIRGRGWGMGEVKILKNAFWF